LKPRIVAPRKPRPPLYGLEVIGALRFCWAVLGAPTGKRLAPVLGELVPTLRRFGELELSEEVAVALMGMSAATIDATTHHQSCCYSKGFGCRNRS